MAWIQSNNKHTHKINERKKNEEMGSCCSTTGEHYVVPKTDCECTKSSLYKKLYPSSRERKLKLKCEFGCPFSSSKTINALTLHYTPPSSTDTSIVCEEDDESNWMTQDVAPGRTFDIDTLITPAPVRSYPKIPFSVMDAINELKRQGANVDSLMDVCSLRNTQVPAACSWCGPLVIFVRRMDVDASPLQEKARIELALCLPRHLQSTYQMLFQNAVGRCQKTFNRMIHQMKVFHDINTTLEKRTAQKHNKSWTKVYFDFVVSQKIDGEMDEKEFPVPSGAPNRKEKKRLSAYPQDYMSLQLYVYWTFAMSVLFKVMEYTRVEAKKCIAQRGVV